MKKFILLIILAAIQPSCKSREVAIQNQTEKTHTEESQNSKVLKGSTTEAEQERAVATNKKEASTGESVEVLEFEGGTIHYNANTGETKIDTKGKTKFTRQGKTSSNKETNVTDKSKTKSTAVVTLDSSVNKKQVINKAVSNKVKQVKSKPPNLLIIAALVVCVLIIIWQYKYL